MNEVMKAILDRRSTRGFSEVQLTEAQLQTLIDAALAAPTARNTQMWHFSVVQDKALLDEFCSDAAQLMAAALPAGERGRFNDSQYHMFYHAPTVIFISRPADCDNRFVEVDCGIACQNIALAAHSLDLGSVIVGLPMDTFLSPRGEYYNKAFGFPEGYQFSIGIVLGNNTVTKEAHPIGEGKVNIVK
jgi:nitroreductase